MIASFEAPSNIALIKYMGKSNGARKNTPANASISLTLPQLRTKVVIESTDGALDEWKPFNEDEWSVSELSAIGKEKFLKHFLFLKSKLNIKGGFLIRSGNNFPSDCGIASSASSFAALTGATYELACQMGVAPDLNAETLALLSQEGSGSSARSFMGPLCEWNENGVSEFLGFKFSLRHQVVVLNESKKSVSSSQAHKAVQTSLLYPGRTERANRRLTQLKLMMQAGDWSSSQQIIWEEFWDMHALFHTSSPAFSYMTGATVDALDQVANYWEENKDGPWVTMDAGPNIHLIYREDQKDIIKQFRLIFSDFTVLEGV
jgi:diphosphomevalonate decarboxylase